METIFNATHDVVMVLDGESQEVLHVNATVYRMLGMTPQEVLGKPVQDILVEANPELLEEAQLVDGVYGPLQITCAGGGIRHVDITVAVIPWDGKPALLYSLRDVTERTRLEEERGRLIRELQDALATVKQLSGLLPICANCKRIRDDDGYWATVEHYIAEHTQAQFSHGICPECRDVLYPEFSDQDS